ncbi:MAG: hypothetical protein RRA92_06205 [Gemmatimonadota bacterium]|nr:hypothetical protein [Gemmatimonadota bacterium]
MSGGSVQARVVSPGHRLLELPELAFALFAFLLNFVWEMLQVPFFVGVPLMPHWDAVLFCTRATLGDAGIAVVAFWLVAGTTAAGRGWALRPGRRHVIAFVAAGVGITAVLEIFFTRVWPRWTYSQMMPILPLLDVGVVPILQWVVLPPLIVWLVRRHLT